MKIFYQFVIRKKIIRKLEGKMNGFPTVVSNGKADEKHTYFRNTELLSNFAELFNELNTLKF